MLRSLPLRVGPPGVGPPREIGGKRTVWRVPVLAWTAGGAPAVPSAQSERKHRVLTRVAGSAGSERMNFRNQMKEGERRGEMKEARAFEARRDV